MVKPKITFYDLSHEEYCKIIDAIEFKTLQERTAWIAIEKMGKITGDPYSELTLRVENKKKYLKHERDEAVQILKGLVSLLDFS